MDRLIDRIRAAWAAAKDPQLVGEAEGMRASLHHIYICDGFALLSADCCAGVLIPRIQHLDLRDQQAVNNYLRRH